MILEKRMVASHDDLGLPCKRALGLVAEREVTPSPIRHRRTADCHSCTGVFGTDAVAALQPAGTPPPPARRAESHGLSSSHSNGSDPSSPNNDSNANALAAVSAFVDHSRTCPGQRTYRGRCRESSSNLGPRTRLRDAREASHALPQYAVQAPTPSLADPYASSPSRTPLETHYEQNGTSRPGPMTATRGIPKARPNVDVGAVATSRTARRLNALRTQRRPSVPRASVIRRAWRLHASAVATDGHAIIGTWKR